MSKTPVAYQAADISLLARKLRNHMLQNAKVPSHLELLNILARVSGYRNFQHLREQMNAPIALARPAPEAPDTTLLKRMERLARCFDREGRLLRWPNRRSDQISALWILWLQLPGNIPFSEKSISSWLRKRNGFDDHALLRRDLCGLNLLSRTRDGSLYQKIDREIPAEIAELQQFLRISAS